MIVVTPQDHERIAAAIHAAESQTNGEIHAVMARRSDDYLIASGFVVSACLILVAALLAFYLDSNWHSISLSLYSSLVLGAWLVCLGLLWFLPNARLLFIPKSMARKRAHQNAAVQFLARNMHSTQKRTGVLLFVSLAEHYAEVIADEGIASCVDQSEWNTIVDVLVSHASKGKIADGFEAAAGLSGALLAKHFPKTADDSNELDDHLVEL